MSAAKTDFVAHNSAPVWHADAPKASPAQATTVVDCRKRIELLHKSLVFGAQVALAACVCFFLRAKCEIKTETCTAIMSAQVSPYAYESAESFGSAPVATITTEPATAYVQTRDCGETIKVKNMLTVLLSVLLLVSLGMTIYFAVATRDSSISVWSKVFIPFGIALVNVAAFSAAIILFWRHRDRVACGKPKLT